MAPRPLALALAGLVALGASGCAPKPGPSAAEPPEPAGTPAAPVSPEARSALAQGPPLRLDNQVLGGEASLLEKLQDALARLSQAEEAKKELAARLNAATQRNTAAQQEAAELERQVQQLTQMHDDAAQALAKAQAQLQEAQATIQELRPKAQEADRATQRVATLAEQIEELKTANQQLRDKLLQAELDRVKAQQDLVALQIVMARQRALIRRKGGDQAKAPTPQTPVAQETSP
ncbi:MAG: hypothetical protein ACLF0G_03075 [Candidatus Brocadiia bacterium]